MDDKDLTIKKITPLASAIGAGIGVIHGSKNNSVVSSTAIGAGVGLLAGLMANAMFSTNENSENTAELTEKAAKE